MPSTVTRSKEGFGKMRVTDFKAKIATMLRDPNQPSFPNSAHPSLVRQPTDFGYFPPTISGISARLRAQGAQEAAFAKSISSK